MISNSSSDEAAIRQTCLDFLEGWYTGDAERVARSLHPELVKRSVMPNSEGTWILRRSVSRAQMVEWARQGGGSEVAHEDRVYEITIDRLFRHIATVSAVSAQYVDFLHLAKVEKGWVIVHDLWELREGLLEN